ncbi:hypothetical protein [Vagococcus lutrae]|uniref:hypothetical protein n=1 Tax=Vagococcus lutrae TaxID=81947 RepID=UPI0020982599|nr:hypothetical protein [Vagococcus lutrae]MCO7151259.1 hypothetical protein [Vagococcus lutrae]
MMLGQIGLNSIMYLIICVGFLVKQQFKVNKNQRKWLISSTIAVILLQMVYIWTVLPSKSLLNYLSHNIIIGLIAVGVVYLAERNADVISSAKNHSSIKLALILVGSFVLLLGASFTYDIASKKHVYSTLTLVEGQDTPELDKDDTPVTIPPKTVRNKMKKSMNQFDNQQFYELGELQVQKIAGDVVYVAPLEFKGIWRWLKAGASEGYLKMSATDVYEQPVPVKREMTYIPSAYFFKDAARKIYFASARYKSMGVPQLEIGDNGKAYYVQTLYRPRGISENPNYKKMKIAVLDTETGKVTLYDLKDVPKFIDAPISPEMASEMNSVYGKYEEGWLNSQLAKKGVKLATTNGTEDEVTPIFNEKGEMLYFTDFTSPSNSDDSAIVYSYINARTGELTYYSKKNMMDSEGLLSLVNLVYPEKKLVGNMPLLYNIDDVPTWVVSMLDKNGIFKKIAYVNATDTDILAMEDTVDKALQVYRLKLGEKRSNVTATSKVTEKEISGQIVRLTSPIETSDGVIIKFVLDDNRIYTASEADNPLALFLQATDKVHFSAKLVDDEVQGYITNLSIEGFDIQ